MFSGESASVPAFSDEIFVSKASFMRPDMPKSLEAWVAAIPNTVMTLLDLRKTPRAWLHRGFIYDLGLMVLAVPFGFYVSWRLRDWINAHFGATHPVLVGIIYVYIVLAILWIYRGLFGYTKWAFPAVELSDNGDRAVTHRVILGSILIAIIAELIWTLIGKM